MHFTKCETIIKTQSVRERATSDSALPMSEDVLKLLWPLGFSTEASDYFTC